MNPLIFLYAGILLVVGIGLGIMITIALYIIAYYFWALLDELL